MSGPNAEQKLAIEHRGGVLLKAGAGSGKTFVLIEHIKYLVNEWIEEYRRSGQKEFFRSFLKSKFSKVVLMTFTKMAAGEISIRLFHKFKNEVDIVDEDLRPYWLDASELVDSITVSTIHGFCFKLIRQGFLKDVDAQDEMLDEIEFKLIIESLFDRWIENEIHDEATPKTLIDLMLKDKEHLLSSLGQIIGDPSLRLMWQDISQKGLSIDHERKIWEALFEEEGVNEVFKNFISLSTIDEFQGKKWADFLKSFESLKKGKISSREDVLQYLLFFKELDYKIPRSPTGKAVSDELKDYYKNVKDLATFFKNYGEDFYHYITHYDEVVSTWFALFQKLVDFVDFEYSNAAGLTFADLEYMVWKGLRDEETVKKIAESYEYFIVDEFQDTSYIQFEIIEKLIQKNFNKLFCVGDVKQAIYGFRGGELGVFLECQNKVPKVLSLKNNYRSLSDIINFNNNFFDFLFKKGLGFEGIDNHRVEVEYQSVPSEDIACGKVYPLTFDLNDNGHFEDDAKMSNREVEYIEALRLLTEIKKNRKDYPLENIAILYKRLKPAQQLIYLLLKEEIGFTAQVKVPYINDPIIGIFYGLVQLRFDTNTNKVKFTNLLVQKYLELLGIIPNDNLEQLINEIAFQEKYFGLYQAFLDFMASVGISNSNYVNNLQYIESIINLASGDERKILLLLQDGQDSTYSMNFQVGTSPEKVVIMTAHSSKGLQYDHVMLGGIYTNDARMPISPLFGKLPMSLQWSLSLEGKKRFKTPQYIYEQLLNKKKEFSEAKRLFYVACTRAKKSLSWVDTEEKYKMKTPQKGSWANGLRKWLNESDNNEVLNKTMVATSKEEIVFETQVLSKMENSPPLFHIDSLGNTSHISLGKELLPVSELSVTRLATISDCPRKFYLKNICKLDDEDLAILNFEKIINFSHSDEEALTSTSFLNNSAQRGSEIHQKLSAIIKSDFENVEIAKNIQQPIDWAVDKLKTYVNNFELISEKSIKFELFGHMISGIPDLYYLSKDTKELTEIWDFKTGKRSENKEVSYWFQLMCYAYAAYKLNLTSYDQPIKLVLCYVDNQLMPEKNVSFEIVENYFEQYWKKLKTPWVINPDHCTQCSFNNICLK